MRDPALPDYAEAMADDDDLSELAARRAEDQEKWREGLRAEHRRLVADLRSRRTELGLSQVQVAARIGVGRSQISNAENGTFLLSVESLIGYAIAVGAQVTIVDR